VKKLAGVGLEAWAPAHRVWAATHLLRHLAATFCLLDSSIFFYQKNLFMRSLDLILS
jgi:hypothetical protein